MNDFESNAINYSDYIFTDNAVINSDITVSGKDIQIFDKSELANQVHDDYVENKINERLKKYDLTYEELEAFIEKYEPERLI